MSALVAQATRPALAGNLNGSVTFIPIATNAYGTDDTNSCAVSRNNLITVGGYQYTAYYQYNSASSGTIIVGRRATGSSTWSLVTTPYTLTNSGDSLYSGAIDDHDVVAMAVDGNGDMHLSWGMHNNALNYAISTPANGSTFSSSTVTFTTQTASNNPNLFSQFTTSGVSQVTYPEFYYVPSTGNLVFDYRDAASASGGGSGNGNTYFTTYNASTRGFAVANEVLDGGITSVNGYQNRLVYDSKGNLVMTWTWRSTPNFQTNNNIMFAQSPDNGATWYQQGGTTQYTTPIIANTTNGGSNSQVAQIVQSVSQNSSLINQSSMTVDKNNNPVIATWLTPNGNASLPVSSTNNPNLQYELIYYNGTAWTQSQITHRTSDTAFDTAGSDVRDLGRPIVLVDSSNRVLVIGRSEDTSMGSYSNASTPNNNLTVYWNTMSSLDSANPAPWKSFALDTANMGEYEPSYDTNLWTTSNTLDLFYEPVGLSGETNGTAQVLQWTESSFNFSSATPSVMTWNTNTTGTGILDGGGTWNTTSTNFSDGYSNYAWNGNFSNGAVFGAANGSAGNVSLAVNVTLTSLQFNATGSGSYNITAGGGTMNLASGTTIVANANATISAPIITSGTLTKTGAGILTFSGNNTISGTLQLGTGETSGGDVNGAVCITSAAAVNGVTLINLTGNNSAYDLLQMNSGTGSMTLPASVTFNLNANSAGTGGLAATIFESIAGNNTVQGPITFNVGGKGYGIAVDSGSLTFSGSQTTSHVFYLRGAGNGSFTGNLSGTGSFEVDGPGTWSLGGADTYSGTTNVAGGTLNIATGASITSTAVAVFPGATLNVLGAMSTASALNVSGVVNYQPNTSGGILSRTVASLNISAGGVVNLVAAPIHLDRTVLITSAAPVFGGTTNSWVGKIDLANNDLIERSGSLANVISQVKQAYNGGYWNGSAGITSSYASADTTHLTTLGVIQNTQNGSPTGTVLYNFDGATGYNTDVLVKLTYFGDANLDGKVDGSDYSRIDNGVLNGNTGWFNGDFNYDGVINGSDYTLIDNSFNTQGPSLLATNEVATVTTEIVAPASITAVPEPMHLSLIIAALAPLSRRRWRRRIQPSAC